MHIRQFEPYMFFVNIVLRQQVQPNQIKKIIHLSIKKSTVKKTNGSGGLRAQ